MKNNYLIYVVCLLFFFSCSQKTEQEKIIEKIEENPELFTQLLGDLNNISIASIPRYIPKEEIPIDIINLFPDSDIQQLMLVDLTIDGNYEACILLDSLGFKKMSIINNVPSGVVKIDTDWLSSDGEAKINARERILVWEIQNKNQKQYLKFRYLNRGFRLIKNERNISYTSVDTIRNIRQELNYLTKENRVTRNIFLVQEGGSSSTEANEKIEMDSLFLLQEINEKNRYLNFME